MKIICLTKDSKKRVLVNSLKEPDYKEKYLQEDGSKFENKPEASIKKAIEVKAPKPKTVVKNPSKKPKKK